MHVEDRLAEDELSAGTHRSDTGEDDCSAWRRCEFRGGSPYSPLRERAPGPVVYRGLDDAGFWIDEKSLNDTGDSTWLVGTEVGQPCRDALRQHPHLQFEEPPLYLLMRGGTAQDESFRRELVTYESRQKGVRAASERRQAA
jgi:hypothetical protein